MPPGPELESERPVFPFRERVRRLAESLNGAGVDYREELIWGEEGILK